MFIDFFKAYLSVGIYNAYGWFYEGKIILNLVEVDFVEKQDQVVMFVGVTNDDDKQVVNSLEATGYDVVVKDFSQSFDSLYSDIFESEVHAVVINEIASEYATAYDFLKFLANRVNCAVLFVGKSHDVVKEVLALELGADDYMTYPIYSGVLIARLRNAIKSHYTSEQKKDLEIRYPGLVVNLSQYKVEIDGEIIKMPPKELELLYLLASNPNIVYTREKLLDIIWGYELDVGSRTVDVHVKRLRDKIEKDSNVWQIATVWSVGYRFELKDSYNAQTIE